MLLQVLPSFTQETFEISDGVYSFASGGSYFSMFIVTGDGVIVIEPIRTEHSKQMLEAIQNITSEPISSTVTTIGTMFLVDKSSRMLGPQSLLMRMRLTG